jgi:hypothetical protein
LGERVSDDFGGGDLVREVRHAGEVMKKPRRPQQSYRVFRALVKIKTAYWHRLLAYELGISVDALEAQGRADEARRARQQQVAA